MNKSYSIAEARNELPELIHDTEHGGTIEITRRGKPVAVVLSIEEYRRIVSARPTFAEAYGAWQNSVDRSITAVDSDYFSSLRDRTPGRDIKI